MRWTIVFLAMPALACGGNRCATDAECAAGEMCSRLGAGCLRTLVEQHDFSDLSGWSFQQTDGGAVRPAPGTAMTFTTPSISGRARFTALRTLAVPADGALELAVVIHADLGSGTNRGTIQVGAYGTGTSTGVFLGTNEPGLDADYRLILRVADQVSGELHRMPDDAFVHAFVPVSVSGFRPEQFAVALGVPDGASGSASLTVKAFSVAQER